MKKLVLTLLLTALAMTSWANTGTYNIQDYKAIGDGTTLNTQAIQKAIDTCAENGGGMVIIPPGTWLTGAIFLKSYVHLNIMAGATLLASEDFSDYPPVNGRWEGIERKVYASLITGHDLNNISITGRGTLDGQGKVWWDAHYKNQELRKKYGITEREPSWSAAGPVVF